MDLPWLMCRYVNHTAKVSSTSSSRSLNCFRIFFTGNRSIVAAAASSAAAAKKEYQPLLSLTLQRTSPDVTMSYLQHHQVRFAATKLLVSQSHLHNSNRMKVSAACQLAVLKFVASQCHMSPDGSRFSLVLLKVIFTISQLLLGLARFTKRCRNVTLQQQKKVSCFSL